MSDYIDSIDRQEAIDAFNEQNWRLSDIPSYPICKEIRKSAQDTIRSLPSVQPQRWIPVTEKLPEKRGYYLVTIDDSGVQNVEIHEFRHTSIDPASEYYKGEYWWYDYDPYDCEYCDDYGLDVVAWMPLPEAYRED